MDSSSCPTKRHDAEILDQFTRQAEPFVQRHTNRDSGILTAMIDCARVSADDTVLDTACGPGIVTCLFARYAGHVTGLDIVPAMLERAQRYQAEQQVENVTWQLGSSTDLPFPAETFDCAVTRFSLHHFLEPETALREMARVVKPGGTVLVCDISPRSEVQKKFNHWEKLRDPSHVRAMTEAEFASMGTAAGLEPVRKERLRMEVYLDNFLADSFPKPGDAEKVRALFEEEVNAGTDNLGVAAHRKEGRIHFAHPILIFTWSKPLKEQ